MHVLAVIWFFGSVLPQEEIMARADRLLWEGKPDSAAVLYRKLLRSDTPSELRVSATLKLGRCYADMGKPEKAVKFYEDYLRMKPGDREVERLLADTYAWMGEHERALRLYEDLLEDVPEDTLLLRKAARVAVWGGMAEKARKLWERLGKLVSGDPEVLKYLGLLWAGRDPRRAEGYLREYLNLGKEDYYAAFVLGEVYTALGKKREAEVAYRHALDWMEGDTRLVREVKARIYARLGERKKAEEEFLRLLGEDDDPRIRLALVEVWMEEGKLSEAERTLKELSRVQDIEVQRAAERTLGVLYFRKGDYRQAIAYWEPLFEKDPENRELALDLAKYSDGSSLTGHRTLLSQKSPESTPAFLRRCEGFKERRYSWHLSREASRSGSGSLARTSPLR